MLLEIQLFSYKVYHITFGQAFCRIEDMKKINILPLLLIFIPVLLSSCELIGDIFQAGLIVGVLVVIVVIGLLIWILRKIF